MYIVKFKDGSEREFESLVSANLRRANLTDADLRRVDLRGANLTGADLTGINLRYAKLEGADLTGADLRNADLEGADISFTDILGFYAGRHFGFAHFGSQYENGSYVKIGCEGHSLPYWLENYAFIGKKYDYSTNEIAIYRIILRSLVEIKERKEMEE